MRAFENQLSGTRPIRRSGDEKRKQLAMLRQQLASLTVRAQDATRNAIKAKIAELEREIGGDSGAKPGR